MFVGTVAAALRRKAGRSLAQRQFPQLVERTGLSFEAPKYPGWVGQLRGRWSGYEVLVQPDERARLVVWLRAPLGVDLRSYQHWKRTPEGKVAFSLRDRRLDAWLLNRLCKAGDEAKLADAPLVIAALDAVRSHPKIKQLVLDEERLELSLDYGSPTYIPAADVEPLLQLAVRVLNEVEACLRG
jgi:hypothetical protein